MNFYLDAHTHTIASGHAYNTIKEMVLAASQRGLKLLGITEHSMRVPGACHPMYFQNFKILPRNMYGIEVCFGAEVNIIDYNGTVDMEIDMDPKHFRNMDINIASIHHPCYNVGTIKENTNAIVKAMQNPYIDIIGHPDDGRIALDYEALVKEAKRCNKLLEINNHSLDPISVRYEGAVDNCKTILELCKIYDVEIIVDSDAHCEFQVGVFENAKRVIMEMNFPDRLIVNNDLEKFKSHINRYRNVLK